MQLKQKSFVEKMKIKLPACTNILGDNRVMSEGEKVQNVVMDKNLLLTLKSSRKVLSF